MASLAWKRAAQLLSILVCTLVYNEFLVYYIVLSNCRWPHGLSQTESTHAMLISDPHLLGPTGHWWDRLRREWQMQRAFQTSLYLLKPEIVFILGDLFDDGKWSSDAAFQQDVVRFHKIFGHLDSVELISVMGNHDVGFHYMINSHKLERFVKAVNSSDSVQHIRHKNLSFVTVNSMAFEGDNCDMCRKAEEKLEGISRQLQCAESRWEGLESCDLYSDKFLYSPPILLQHFPMYRESDSMCEGPDSTPEEYKYDKFRVKMDCLSPEASEKLKMKIKPRLIISGHTHYFCLRKHRHNIEEWSIPSFSWRNIKSPSFLLVSMTPDDYEINRCFMPNENTVYLVYFLVITLVVLYLIYLIFAWWCNIREPHHSKVK